MAIVFPDEKGVSQGGTSEKIASQGESTVDMGMLAARLDVNTNQRILINDGSNDVILIGYQLNGF